MHFIHTSFVHLKMDICEFVYSLTLKVSRHRVTAEASDGTLDSDVKQLLYSVSASNANMQNTVHHSAKIKIKTTPKSFSMCIHWGIFCSF